MLSVFCGVVLSITNPYEHDFKGRICRFCCKRVEHNMPKICIRGGFSRFPVVRREPDCRLNSENLFTAFAALP